jgi:1-aminocyclopropane-1-carboxylate deaminase/D-cysteine desulfhydrase-like pyridoxal-dependent ACC family enzyme
MELTRVDDFGGWWVKREDTAAFAGLEYPSGSKVRQYAAMANAAPGAPMIVGCASYSAMQIYVAAAAKQAGVSGIIYVPERTQRTPATEYAMAIGGQINTVRPGHDSVVRKRARERAKQLGRTVRWDVQGALRDAYAQTENLPDEVKRVVVATGSGLTAAGVLAGLSERKRPPEVLAVAVSELADRSKIIEHAQNLLGPPPGGRSTTQQLPRFTLIRSSLKYGDYLIRELPDGTPLDPYYAAKAFDILQSGDCLWTPGLRPVCSMPIECRQAFSGWKGFGS